MRSVDAVGNVSDVRTNTVSSSDISEPGLQVPAQIPDYSNEPSLSSSQSKRSVDIALADSRLAALIDGRSYSISKPVAWTYSSGAFIGATLSINFTNAATSISGSWPSFSYESETSDASSYQTYLAEYTATSVPSLDVFVDLSCEGIVSISPGGDATVDSKSVAIKSNTTQPACQVSGIASDRSSLARKWLKFGNRSLSARSTRTSVSLKTALVPPPGSIWYRNVKIINIGSDSFYNYDFHSTHSVNQSNTDNPVNLVFTGNQTLSKGDIDMYRWGGNGITKYAGSPQYEHLKRQENGFGWVWDSSRGYKDRIPYDCGTNIHYRVYFDDYGTPKANNYWGFYLIGTAHEDKGDLGTYKVPGIGITINPCGRSQYGWQELAEQKVANEAAKDFGESAVIRSNKSKIFLNNYVKPHWQDNTHYDRSDGKATKITVCLDQSGKRMLCTPPPPPPCSGQCCHGCD
ncbi:MAG: hypothetical protein ABSB96_10285 [Gaiellaceae bacterium]